MVMDVTDNIQLEDFARTPHAPDALAQGIQQENDRAGGWSLRDALAQGIQQENDSLRVGRSLPHGYGNRADMYLAGQSCDLIPWARPIW